jgi:branched-chain amino acid transport system substrate-binding protein
VIRPRWLVDAVLVALFVGAACKGGGAQDARSFRIGVITSLTGPAAAFGQAHKNGYAVAVAELNARGGILGKAIELLYYDDQSKPDQAVQGVAKLVDQDHAPIILGAFTSENTRAMIPAVTQKQVPLIMPTAIADNVSAAVDPGAVEPDRHRAAREVRAGQRKRAAVVALLPDTERFSSTSAGCQRAAHNRTRWRYQYDRVPA